MAANLRVLEDPVGTGYMVKIPSPSFQVFYELANFFSAYHSQTGRIERLDRQVDNRRISNSVIHNSLWRWKRAGHSEISYHFMPHNPHIDDVRR
jgi:hypothetical protein